MVNLTTKDPIIVRELFDKAIKLWDNQQIRQLEEEIAEMGIEANTLLVRLSKIKREGGLDISLEDAMSHLGSSIIYKLLGEMADVFIMLWELFPRTDKVFSNAINEKLEYLSWKIDQATHKPLFDDEPESI